MLNEISILKQRNRLLYKRLIPVITLGLLLLIPQIVAAGTVTTDKSDYTPGETVIITGTGFTPGADYDIPVIRPDGTTIKGDGTDTPGWDVAQADGSGNFTYSYILDGIEGVYEVRVYDNPWSGQQSEVPLATTIFTDYAITNYEQWANGTATKSPKWQTGAINQNNSHYVECNAVPFRLYIDDLDAGTHTLTIQWQTTKGGAHAYDYLVGYDWSEDGVSETLPPLGQDIARFSSLAGPYTHAIPLDANIPTYHPLGNQVQPSGENFTIYNATITNISSHLLTGSTTGDSDTEIQITINIDPNVHNGYEDKKQIKYDFLLAWGGHVSQAAQWNGEPTASSISGKPYHMQLTELDNKNPGQRDLQMGLGDQPTEEADLSLLKIVDNGTPYVGDDVTFTITVTNDGPDVATNITVRDIVPNGYTYVASSIGSDAGATGATITPNDLSAPTLTWGIDELDANESVTLTFQATVLASGNYLNCAEITAVDQTDPDSDPNSSFDVDDLDDQVEDDDEDCAEVVPVTPDPRIDIEKATNGVDADTPTGPQVPVGSTVTWTYLVTNPGNVAISNIVVTDDNGTPSVPGDDFNPTPVTSGGYNVGDTNTDNKLDPGETWQYQAIGTAQADQYANIGTATGDGPTGPVSDSDPSHYFGEQTGIDIEKATNAVDPLNPTSAEDADTPTGPQVIEGTTVTWTYLVTNPGNVSISNVVVSDNNGTPSVPGDDFNPTPVTSGGYNVGDTNTDNKLDPGEVWQYQATGTAQLDQYANIGTVTGDGPTGPVSETDASHYFGEKEPTAVKFSAMSASLENDQVIVSWSTESEINNAGFNIYRSKTEVYNYIKLNDGLIEGQGDPMSGATYNYTDQPSVSGSYNYKVEAVDINGQSEFHGPVSVSGITSIEKESSVVLEYRISQNYPNPFNPETNIQYALPKDGYVTISIYDIKGQLVRTLVNARKTAGTYSVIWNSRDDNGIKVTSGVYFYRINAGEFTLTKKMILMK